MSLKAAGTPLLVALIVLSLETTSHGEPAVSIGTSAQLHGGYDSYICILSRSHPSPVKEPCDRPAAYFWGIQGNASAEVFLNDWFGFDARPGIVYTGFYKASYLLEPSFRFDLVFRPKPFLELDIGAHYRWFNFKEFPSGEFHELAPSASILFSSEKHLFQVGYAWLKRYTVNIEGSERESILSALWSYRPLHLLMLEAGASWAYQRGYDKWTDLNEILFPFGFRFSYKWFYLQPVYMPGAIKYDFENDTHFTHHVSAAIGFIPIEYVDISIFYEYQQIFAVGGPQGSQPAYSRHVGGLSIEFSWSASSPAGKHAFEKSSPASCKDGKCIFKIRNEDAKEVFLAGTFNEWKERQNPMSGPDPDGYWTLMLTLAPGRHKYIFLCDGVPTVPDNAAAYEEDDFGTKSAIVNVP